MPLVSAKCTNCGANLNVDNLKDAAICPYCNSAFIVEKAINNYNIANHITAKTVNVFSGNSVDFVIHAGVLEKYIGASTVVTIPNNVVEIGERAFYKLSRLTSIIVPSTVTHIGNEAFSGCTGLTSINIPNSVTVIGSCAFTGCAGLTNITIPDSVIKIDAGAFSDCTHLTSIILPRALTVLSDSLFVNCISLVEINIPNEIISIGSKAFRNCSCLKEISIPNTVTSIGSCAFYDCKSIKKIYLPDGLTHIAEETFCHCTSLEEMYIPDSVTSVSRYTVSFSDTWPWAGCQKLKRVKAPEHLSCYVFYGSAFFEEHAKIVREQLNRGYCPVCNAPLSRREKKNCRCSNGHYWGVYDNRVRVTIRGGWHNIEYFI